MAIEVKVPTLPESVADATIAAFHKQVGEHVNRDENLVDLETDKVVLEVPAPDSGVIKEIKQAEGDTVEAGTLLIVLEAGAAANDDASTQAPATQAPNGDARAASNDAQANPDKQQNEPSPATGNHDNLSPAVRKMVTEHSLDVSQIQGTGKGGRILKEDVQQYINSDTKSTHKPEPIPSKPASNLSQADVGVETMGDRTEKRVPMTRLRARIAERLLSAQANAAILTTFNEVNMQPVMDLRNRYKADFEKNHGIKLGFMSFFIKAAVEALKEFPAVNASIDGGDIVYHGYCDVGVAVSSPRGLVVPIIRNAENLSMAKVESAIADYGQKAKDGSLSIDDMTGGTFTISNGGIFGSMLSTPILNPPQSGILGMHNIVERAVVENGEIVIRPMMYLALSYDHRIIDGREAVQFLVKIKNGLEDPARLLLNV